jgi:hypothetical protein
VALVADAVAEVRDRVLGPLVGLRQEHAIGVVGVDVRAQALEEAMRLRQVLAVRALALVEVGDGIEAQPVDAGLQPEVGGLEQCFLDTRLVEVQVRLMTVEAVPEVGTRDWVPRPVGGLEVLEDDARVRVALRTVTPHVPVALG